MRWCRIDGRRDDLFRFVSSSFVPSSLSLPSPQLPLTPPHPTPPHLTPSHPGLGGKIPGKPKQKKNGAFVVLNEQDLTIIHEARDSKEWIIDVKFSPDGESLCVASRDNSMYLYNVEEFASKGKCKGHRAPLTHFDFSADGQFMQSNCENKDMLFWNAATGEQYKAIANMKDVEWHSWTCSLGWPVQGIGSPLLDGTDVLCAARSRSNASIVTGDNYGRLVMQRYPCLEATRGFKRYRGHSVNIRNVAFSADSRKLISVGGSDRCVFQWRHDEEIIEDEAERFNRDLDSEDDEDLATGKKLDRTEALEAVANAEMDVLFDKEDKWAKEEFKAVKPWVGSVVAPTHPPKEDHTAPNADLELEWVYGYRSQGTRNNLRYNDRGDIVYHCDAVNVVMTKGGGGMQKHHVQHTGLISCMAMHPEKMLFATGEMGKTPKIIVWNSETMKNERVISGFHRRGIAALQFSRDGKRLVSLGFDDDHSIALYDWKNRTLLCSFHGGKEKVMAIDMTPNGAGILQCGVNVGVCSGGVLRSCASLLILSFSLLFSLLFSLFFPLPLPITTAHQIPHRLRSKRIDQARDPRQEGTDPDVLHDRMGRQPPRLWYGFGPPILL